MAVSVSAKTSTRAVCCAQIADIGVEPRSGRSLPAIRATAVARARSDPERRHGLGMLSVAQAGWTRT